MLTWHFMSRLVGMNPLLVKDVVESPYGKLNLLQLHFSSVLRLLSFAQSFLGSQECQVKGAPRNDSAMLHPNFAVCASCVFSGMPLSFCIFSGISLWCLIILVD